jgi:glycosyltransferase involved in cell wall biosynthesis
MAEQVKVSLIVSTLGRTIQLEKLLDSLTHQEWKAFEVIIVDQNGDDRLVSVVNPQRWPFPVRRIHTPDQRGLSCGRNEGIKYADGSVLLFPDDDCWYPPWLLAKGMELLEKHRCASVTGRAADETGRSINGRFAEHATWIDRRNVWITQIEWVVFFRREAIITVGGYDENIGIGSSTPWGANEGQDLTLRLLEAGFTAYYDPDLFGFHIELLKFLPSDDMIRKGRSYARGFGYVLRKHRYGITSLCYWVLRPALRAASLLLKGEWRRSRYYVIVLLGRIEGWLGKVISA